MRGLLFLICLVAASSEDIKARFKKQADDYKRHQRRLQLTLPAEYPLVPAVYEKLLNKFDAESLQGKTHFEFCIPQYEEWFAEQVKPWNEAYSQALIAGKVKKLTFLIIVDEWNERYPQLQLHAQGDCWGAWTEEKNTIWSGPVTTSGSVFPVFRTLEPGDIIKG